MKGITGSSAGPGTFAATSGSLQGKGYTCANAGIWVEGGPGDAGPGEDALDGRFIELKAVLTSPPPSSTTEPLPEALPPSASSGTKADEAEAKLTQARARRALRKALAERFGNRFRNRDSYAVNCEKKSASRWTCAVRWHHGQFVYKAKIKLTLRPDGRVAGRLRGSPSRALQ